MARPVTEAPSREADALTPRPCLSVVMPCFNEAETLKVMADRVLTSPYTQELIIVDDGSTDQTLEIARGIADPRVKVLAQPVNLGKGAALRRGFAHATAPYVIVQDADLEYDPSEYGEVLAPLLEDKADVVYGSRFLAGRPHRVLYYWHAVGNRMLTTASNMTTNLNLTDMETCYKAFRREVVQSFTIEEDRFGFEPEITAKVAGGGWRVYEVGISYAGRTYAEGKKIGWKDGVRALYCVVRYSPLLARRIKRLERPEPSPAGFGEADAELAEVLDSLQDASNYAEWIYGLAEPYLGHRVLEVGAGHGAITSLLARGATVTATDLSKRCADILEERYGDHPRVRVHHGAIDDGTLGHDYDSVVLVNVLEHMEHDVEALRELADRLVSGGHVILYVPAFESLYGRFDQMVGHHRRYRRSTLAAAVDDAGLELVEARYVNWLGALGWWVLVKQLGRAPTEGAAVKLFDRLMVPVMRRREARKPPRFGQSLFCVARKP
jgi:2-polyprenyl-3-methyl-5-hydroxy-6-metoxy-1,4-benzoquinol methylase